ncbi:MAG: hypothetical protein R3F17_06070 [Planctomycetota bacterium]
MPRIAFLTAGCMLPDAPDRREDHWEFDLEWNALQPACEAAGLQIEPMVWDGPEVLTEAFDAYVVGTTWDYAERHGEFLERLAELDRRGVLLNPLRTIAWNSHKSYLRELEQRGVPVVPTLWREDATEASLQDAFETLGCDEIVIKPQVGAGAWRQERVRKGAPWPSPDRLPPGTCMVQPFLPRACDEGEFSLVYFDGVFSHCAQKRPAPGDYRVQSIYGAREVAVDPPADMRAVARQVLEATAGPLLYARVDLMRDGNTWRLMELELIEPYLYPEQGPHMGMHFANALQRILQRIAERA